MSSMISSQPLDRDFYRRPVLDVAKDLLGLLLIRRESPILAARIVEVEAYHQEDPASHSYRGQTARTETMFGAPGHAYVYLIYGMHYCFNVVCEDVGTGSAVLVRAVEPVTGEEIMAARRSAARKDTDVTNGPAKLSQAFGITRSRDNGKDLTCSDLEICASPAGEAPAAAVVSSRRIGISKATELEWRFYLAGNPFVSRTG